MSKKYIRKILREIFSIHNDCSFHKVFTIIGIKIKISNSKKIKQKLQSYIEILNYLKPYINFSIQGFIDNCHNKKYSIKQFKEITNEYNKILGTINPCSVKSYPKGLRELQYKELNFAKEILSRMEEADIIPFMDGGTLLGACRHGGFIPWDDDFDFALMRSDFEKLENYFKTNYIFVDTREWSIDDFEKMREHCFEKYPNQVFAFKCMTSIDCYRGTKNNFVKLDFFALDFYNNYHNVATLRDYIEKTKKEVYKLNNLGKIFDFRDSEIKKRQDIVEDSNVIYAGIDNFDFYSYSIKGIKRKSDIFPLKKMKFEDTEFWAPNNPHECLRIAYRFYNKMPKNLEIATHFKKILNKEN